MERRIRAAALALLAVVVTGVAAASLDETTRQVAPGLRDDQSGGAPAGGFPDVDPGAATHVPEVPDVLLVVILLLLLVAVALYPRRTLRQAATAAVVAAVISAVAWLIMQLVEFQPGGRESDEGLLSAGTGEGGVGIGGGAAEGGGAVPEPVVGVLLVVCLVGVGVLAVVARERAGEDATDVDAPDAATLAAIGRTAGRAADRIVAADDPPVDNAVYRAWREMTDHLDVEDPDVRTPGEFRTAALEAGMAREDVDVLTDIFEEVRYGGARPTSDREDAATAALRRIEDRYAEVGSA